MNSPNARFRRVFRYDDADQLVGVDDDRGWTVEYTYDENGNRTALTTTTGVGEPPATPPKTPGW